MYNQITRNSGEEIYIKSGIHSRENFSLWPGGSNSNHLLSLFAKDVDGAFKMMSSKNRLSWLIIFLLSIPVCIAAYWSFYPVDVIEIRNAQFDKGNKFYPGETVAVNVTYDKFMSLGADISKIMIKQDEPNKGLVITIIAATRPGNLPVGLNKHSVEYFVVPLSTPLGKYRLVTSAKYRVNPLRDFYETWESPCFEVVK